MSAVTVPEGSRSELVADEIRTKILAGDLAPGSPLRFPQLREDFDVSVGVLREALVHLVERGLVQNERNLGFRVLSISGDRFAEMMMIRRLTEPPLLQESVVRGTVAWEAEVVASQHVLGRQSDRDPLSAESREAHLRFHRALASGVGSRRVLEINRRMYDETHLYAHWADPSHSQALLCSASDHQALVDAALARDISGCAEVLRSQILQTEERLTAAAPWVNSTQSGR